MTREEAIKVLNTYDVNFYEYTAEEIVDAIDMAVDALKREDTMLKEIERVVLYGERGEE